MRLLTSAMASCLCNAGSLHFAEAGDERVKDLDCRLDAAQFDRA